MKNESILSIAQLKSFIKENYPYEEILDSDQNRIPRFLFRGEKDSTWKQTKSSYGRFVEDFPEQGCSRYAQILYLSAYRGLKGLNGYSITPEEGIAVLQHYGMPTPQIDLTGNIDVAIFFATEDLNPTLTPSLQIIDTQKIPDNLKIVNHDFLVTPDLEESSKHRYVRQDGFAITLKDYYRMDLVKAFDLKSSQYQTFISRVLFSYFDPENIVFKKSYIYEQRDFIAPKIQSILQAMIDAWELEMSLEEEYTLPICQQLKDRIQKIYP